MLEYLQSALLGLIQGVTEFLPVSSSGHLLIFHKLFGETQDTLVLDATLHLATGLALLIYFRKDWYTLLTQWRTSLSKLVIIGSIPAVVVGLLFEKEIESYLRSPWVVVAMLIGVGLLMLVVDKNNGNGVKKLTQLSLGAALFIGTMQAVALLPGTSRAGITLIAGLMVGLGRREALRFTFLLGMPITLGAGLMKIPDLITSSNYNLLPVVLAFSVALITGLVAIRWLLGFVSQHSLVSFVIYRWVLAGVVAIYLLN
ncbi:hypothetical protein COW99_04175 [Candidatus Roizmanbacteria bacterium CG22_combo_CG10-13_8_21_14_all_38_20]|uniref:Undecaprenyl-diphosphatase n=1 Tax=Candidatus Roizmanbacteria bacterium CG22_combo_CG10-13_8_21_14_all_38_20 TaxID=1974862 RepID=A0A2H0BWP0_9BACT|nr:undecaprenyl-diphosphate phosphatase [Candidatus Microgenomates bacterium]PIP61470.1 MAG: hypothetical protein COW99_04175 [Candidatus Roizmanbacteria bacterium CG22_combo_CG10-13_8_21_14_all_38_20]PJC30696.1 MAG: hypothetical protein CO050_05340 [Candidatus Roizmanbacteria bacterium CG_4_9_14_0_2_um_filter_38_17]